MAQSPDALVEPSVLRWARETVGLIPRAAARRIGVPDDRVEQWESGEIRPTVVQLRKAAAVYKRPIAAFFLPEPPTDFDTMRDFRRHAGAAAGSWTPELHGEYRRAITQRQYALELAELDEAPPAKSWRLPRLPSRDADLAAAARVALLAVAPLPLPGGRGDQYEHLNAWTAAVEESGVLVMATMRGGVSTNEMRAFSLYFEQVPVIVLNGSDAPRARLFSLLHEYMHLVLHTGGLCDTVTDLKATSPDRQLEARCNALAAATLMPAALVLKSAHVVARVNHEDAWDYAALAAAAAPFGVSAEAFLRRLLTLGRVSHEFYEARREEFQAAYEHEQKKQAGRGNFYRNTARDLGKGYVRSVADAYRRRVIDSYTAASYLDVKVGQIDKLATAAALVTPV